MYGTMQSHLQQKLAEIEKAGLYKRERIIAGPQQPLVSVAEGTTVLNLCANNYLGLANHPDVVEAAHQALRQWGYGLASVRFISGTGRKRGDLVAAASLGQQQPEASSPPD